MAEMDDAINKERRLIGDGDWLCGRVLTVWRVEQRRQRTNQVPPQQELDRLIM